MLLQLMMLQWLPVYTVDCFWWNWATDVFYQLKLKYLLRQVLIKEGPHTQTLLVWVGYVQLRNRHCCWLLNRTDWTLGMSLLRLWQRCFKMLLGQRASQIFPFPSMSVSDSCDLCVVQITVLRLQLTGGKSIEWIVALKLTVAFFTADDTHTHSQMLIMN